MKIEAMLWVVILVSLAFAILSRKYRLYGLTIVVLAVASVVTVIILARENGAAAPLPSAVPVQRAKRVDFEQFHVEKLDEEDPEAKKRISLSEVRFDQIRCSPGAEPGTIDSIHARLYNDSGRFALTDFSFYLVIQDCVDQVCTTIYDQHGRASTLVPPGQARDVTIGIRQDDRPAAPPFKLLGTPVIHLSATETRAYRNTTVP
ncbi:MAG: hypothetical protein M3O06_07495 [Pseudomonadota bacterium]|nr:hypothetical protein [Pseudomonadota bacterium]